MGADGHVKFYNCAKFEEKFKKEHVLKFYENFLSGQFYLQELEGKKYLSRYYGDNYECHDKYDTVEEYYDPVKDEMNKNPWGYDPYNGDEFMKFKKRERKLFYEMIKFLETECYIASWEVWT